MTQLNELPAGVAAGLGPSLGKLFSRLPRETSDRIVELVKKARRVSIRADRLVKYAFLVVAAEELEQADRASTKQAVDARLQTVAKLHPRDSEDNEDTLRRIYTQGRIACQRIEAALQRVLRNWESCEEVIRKHRAELPAHRQHWFADVGMKSVRQSLLDMRRAASPDEDLLRRRNDEREPPTVRQIYIWWSEMPDYPGRWEDMYQLAKIWKLSAAKHAEPFRANVFRVRRGKTSMRIPFGSSWKQALFERT